MSAESQTNPWNDLEVMERDLEALKLQHTEAMTFLKSSVRQILAEIVRTFNEKHKGLRIQFTDTSKVVLYPASKTVMVFIRIFEPENNKELQFNLSRDEMTRISGHFDEILLAQNPPTGFAAIKLEVPDHYFK